MAPRYLNVSDLPAAQASAERARPRGRAVEVSHDPAPRKTRAHKGDASYSITSTPEAHSADMGRRMVVYGIQMLLRVICLIAFVLVDNWILRIICGAGIIVLPWSAVLLANVGADRSERSSSYMGPEAAEGPAALTAQPMPSEPDFEGEYVDESGRPLSSGASRPGGDGPRDGSAAERRDNGDDPRAG